MRNVVLTSTFKKDYKRLKRSGKYAVELLQEIIIQLANNQLLPEKCHNHALTGNWQNHRECHIKPDWLLIYQFRDDELILVRTGSHSDLF